MTKEQALVIIQAALASVRATLSEHQQIQQALKILTETEKK